MSDPQLEHRIREIIAEQLGISEEDITSDATFTGDLGADSLDFVELLLAFEEEFDVELPEEVAKKLETVGDVLRYITTQTH